MSNELGVEEISIGFIMPHSEGLQEERMHLMTNHNLIL